MPSLDRVTLTELRRTRTRRRLGDVEWFDVAYRAYLIGFAGIIAVVVVSDAIQGLLGDDVTVTQWVTRGPSVLGIPVVLALALGLRSGAEGGPVAIEGADVRHVLLAPVDRRMVLARPIAQRLRAVAFALAIGGAVLAQLVARELDESRGAWAAAGALYGALVGAVFVSSAVVAHALRLPRWTASLVGAVAVVWQSAVAWADWDAARSVGVEHGPADLVGSVALWGVRRRTLDLVALAVILLAVLAALSLGGRLRIEPLVRRGRLVSQLRFAATAQDLRTVVLLRRQLRAETLRATPWFASSHRASGRPTPTAPRPRLGRPLDPIARYSDGAVWRRGVASLRRLPLPRLARMVALATAAGAAGSLTVTSSPLFAAGLLAALFVLGLEVIEPLAQEVDRPGLTERVPVDRGWLFVRHLLAPSALLVLLCVFGVVGATLVERDHLAGALALAIPVAVTGALGPVVAAVRDAPRPVGVPRARLTGGGGEGALVPPEFAGFNTALTALVPVVVSAAGTAPVLAMRASPSAATAVRAAIGVALLVTLVVAWIRRRDAWSTKVAGFLAEGRAAR